MHILTLFGGPRKRGSTHSVLRQFEEIAAQQEADQPSAAQHFAAQHFADQQHTVERITVVDHDVRGCLGCKRCQKVFDQVGCPQKDDALAIFERIMAADLLVYATPLYCWSFTAQMKALLDRHFSLMKWDSQPYFSLMRGKRAALLVTCGDEIEDNADVIQTTFARQMKCCETEVAGMYILPHCTLEKARGEEGAQLARRMASELLQV